MAGPHEHELAAFARALAHPVRVALLRRLMRHGAAPVHTLVVSTGLAQSTVSGHLAILREAGLVHATRRDREVWHTASADGVRRGVSMVAGLGTLLPPPPGASRR